MKFRLAEACSVLLLLAGIGLARPPAQTHRNANAEIRAVLDAQVAAWNRADVLGFMRGYWKSPATEFVSSSGVLRGWEKVLERYRRVYPDKRAMGSLTFSDLEVTLLGPKAALALGHWQLRREHDQRGGVFTLVFRRFPEGWRIINDHTSAVNPTSTR
jgi:ketosteroid isomerase-like protein